MRAQYTDDHSAPGPLHHAAAHGLAERQPCSRVLEQSAAHFPVPVRAGRHLVTLARPSPGLFASGLALALAVDDGLPCCFRLICETQPRAIEPTGRGVHPMLKRCALGRNDRHVEHARRVNALAVSIPPEPSEDAPHDLRPHIRWHGFAEREHHPQRRGRWPPVGAPLGRRSPLHV